MAVVLLVFAAVLVPWIALLALYNATTATAFHVPLMVGGVGGASALLAASASYAAWRRSSTVVPVSLAATTLLTVTLLGAVTVGHPSRLFLAGGGACAVIALVAAVRADRAGARRWPDSLALAVVAAALAVATALTATQAPEQLIAHRVRAAWVGLDLCELAALLGAGVALLRGHARLALIAGSVGATLLLADAWINITAVRGGWDLVSALVFAVVGELPGATLCAWAAWAGASRRRRTPRAEPS